MACAIGGSGHELLAPLTLSVGSVALNTVLSVAMTLFLAVIVLNVRRKLRVWVHHVQLFPTCLRTRHLYVTILYRHEQRLAVLEAGRQLADRYGHHVLLYCYTPCSANISMPGASAFAIPSPQEQEESTKPPPSGPHGTDSNDHSEADAQKSDSNATEDEQRPDGSVTHLSLPLYLPSSIHGHLTGLMETIGVLYATCYLLLAEGLGFLVTKSKHVTDTVLVVHTIAPLALLRLTGFKVVYFPSGNSGIQSFLDHSSTWENDGTKGCSTVQAVKRHDTTDANSDQHSGNYRSDDTAAKIPSSSASHVLKRRMYITRQWLTVPLPTLAVVLSASTAHVVAFESRALKRLYRQALARGAVTTKRRCYVALYLSLFSQSPSVTGLDEPMHEGKGNTRCDARGAHVHKRAGNAPYAQHEQPKRTVLLVLDAPFSQNPGNYHEWTAFARNAIINARKNGGRSCQHIALRTLSHDSELPPAYSGEPLPLTPTPTSHSRGWMDGSKAAALDNDHQKHDCGSHPLPADEWNDVCAVVAGRSGQSSRAITATTTQGALLAMNKALPILTVADAIHEDVVQHGKTGYLLPQDANAFGDHIVQLATSTDVRNQLGTAARRRAQRRFSTASITSTLNNLIIRLAN